ncbi:MAG: sugar transferase [Chloroflexota bacterium]|nr:sugar transferase [Chloroflexota bacterium]
MADIALSSEQQRAGSGTLSEPADGVAPVLFSANPFAEALSPLANSSPQTQPLGSEAGPAQGGRQRGTRFKPTRLRPGERKLLQVVCDLVILLGGAVPVILSKPHDYNAAQVILSLGAGTIFWFFFSSAFDAYSIMVLQSTARSVYAALQTYVLTVSAYLLLTILTGRLLVIVQPTLLVISSSLLLLLLLLGVRVLYSLLLLRAPLRRHLVVVGANPTGYEIVQAITRYGGTSYEFLGYFDDKPQPADESPATTAPLTFPISDLLLIHTKLGIDQIILATPDRPASLLQWLSICHERGIQITPMFALYQDLTGRVPVEHLGNDWFVALPAHRKSTPYVLIKRAFDLILAACVLLVTAPLLPLIALAIRLDSPGPIFFRQARVGRGGKLFRIVKFRSMRQNAEAMTGAVWAQKDDPRITGVGRFIRKSRLDELPQLWNVLRGDMSFVGPRPERPEFDAQLESGIPFYRARRAVSPGLTGWAQIRHGYGNTMDDALRKVEYDLYYIKNESFYLDLLILLRTVAVVFRLRGT